MRGQAACLLYWQGYPALALLSLWGYARHRFLLNRSVKYRRRLNTGDGSKRGKPWYFGPSCRWRSSATTLTRILTPSRRRGTRRGLYQAQRPLRALQLRTRGRRALSIPCDASIYCSALNGSTKETIHGGCKVWTLLMRRCTISPGH